MSSTDHPSPGEDLVGFIRSYTDRGFDGPEDVEELWDRYHTPDSVHVVNQKELDRAQCLKQLSKWRRSETPYDLRIRDAVVDGDRAAVRYTISTGLLWELNMETECNVFHVLADDGRIASSVSTSRTRYVWGGSDEVWDSDAGPGAGPSALSAEGPPAPAQDVAGYLVEYTRLMGESDASATEVFERFFASDCVQHINNSVKHRADIVSAISSTRKKNAGYRTEVHETLRQGGMYAARYSMTPLKQRMGGPDLEVFEFGSFAPDGRVRSLWSTVQTTHGSWPF